MDDTRTLSVVVAIYNEEANLPDLCRRLQAAFATMPDVASKVIYVNDGSTDGSLQIMLEQQAQDARFTVVDLSRNFGHQPAITAGLMATDTDAVVMMDGDLQDPPELIPKLVETWRQGAEVVLAVRSQRAERGIRRVGFEMFYRIMNWMSDFPIPDRVGIFGLIDRRALNELNRLPERNRYLPGLRAWVGFDQRVVTYERREREAGAPKQTLVALGSLRGRRLSQLFVQAAPVDASLRRAHKLVGICVGDCICRAATNRIRTSADRLYNSRYVAVVFRRCSIDRDRPAW